MKTDTFFRRAAELDAKGECTQDHTVVEDIN